jgi:dCMP deaminase
MERPSRDEVSMQIAHVVAQRGTCVRARVGAVLTRAGRILATGYNGPPSGLAHCSDPVYDGGCTILQQKDEGGCTRAVHAEANCIAFAARHGIATEGASLFTTHEPCLKCAELIVNAGIHSVYYHTPYRIKDGSSLLQQAGVDIIQL